MSEFIRITGKQRTEIENYIIPKLQGCYYVGDLGKENGYYYFNVDVIEGEKVLFENKIYEVASIDFFLDCTVRLKIEASFLHHLIEYKHANR